MRHAGQAALDQIDPLLTALRRLPGLREKNRGTFYRGSKAFLHFHEDPAGLFADVRLGAEFQRISVTTKVERDHLVRMVRQALASTQSKQPGPVIRRRPVV